MFVINLLWNGSTVSYKILGAYQVGLRIGQHLFYIPLNVKSNPPLFFNVTDSFFIWFLYNSSSKKSYKSKFFTSYDQLLFFNYGFSIWYDWFLYDSTTFAESAGHNIKTDYFLLIFTYVAQCHPVLCLRYLDWYRMQ